MTFATSSPGASTGGQGTNPPICQNCLTSTTPLWRRDEAGSVLCNACGLFLKLHGRPRPPSLKTDVIKSRNRVKNSSQPQKKKPSLFDSPHNVTSNLSTPRSENRTPPPSHRNKGVSNMNRSASPHSRSGTPLPPPSQMSPSFFDYPYGGADSPTMLPALTILNQPSPAVSTSSLSDRQSDQSMTIDSLINTNNKLKTRVAELELVNDLFRGRVGELEHCEANARRAESGRREIEAQLRQCLDASIRREEDLKRKLDNAERELSDHRGEHQSKKVRVSDLTG